MSIVSTVQTGRVLKYSIVSTVQTGRVHSAALTFSECTALFIIYQTAHQINPVKRVLINAVNRNFAAHLGYCNGSCVRCAYK
jgi:hypothetical protein